MDTSRVSARIWDPTLAWTEPLAGALTAPGRSCAYELPTVSCSDQVSLRRRGLGLAASESTRTPGQAPSAG